MHIRDMIYDIWLHDFMYVNRQYVFFERISLQPGPCEPAPGAGADPAGGSAARNVNVRVGGTVAEGGSTAQRLTSEFAQIVL